MGGVLLPDATKATEGFPGVMPETLGASTLPQGRGLLAHYQRVNPARLPKPRRKSEPKPANLPPEWTPQSGEITDDRVRVLNPNVYPFSAICAVRMKYRASKTISAGTGFLVGPRLLLTAGHNIYSPKYGELEWIKVYPNLNGEDPDTTRCIVGSRWLTVRPWIESKGADEDSDYGAVILPTDLGKTNGWLGVEKRADGDLTGLAFNLAGYPLDRKVAGSAIGTTMWADSGNILRADDNHIYYTTICTASGDSGAPLFTNLAGLPNPYRAVGIHTYGADNANSSNRINDTVFEDILYWLEVSDKA